MNIANSLRNFIDTLFPYRTVLQLRRTIDEERAHHKARQEQADEAHKAIIELYQWRIAELKTWTDSRFEHHDDLIESFREFGVDLERERDYFKGQAERLQLRLLPDPVIREQKVRGQQREAPKPRTWQQVQDEHGKAERESIEKEQAEKKVRRNAPEPNPSPRPDVESAKPNPEPSGAQAPGSDQSEQRGASDRQ